MHSSSEAAGNLHPAHQHNKAPCSPGPVLPFWFLHILWMSLLTGGKWYFFVVQIFIAHLPAWPKRSYEFSPEYIQEKTHTRFLAQCIIVEVVPLFLRFTGDSNVCLEICFLLFCLGFMSASLPSLNRFLDDSCPLLLCQFVNCCAPELCFQLVFCGLNTSPKFWFRTYTGSQCVAEILVNFFFLPGN